MGKFNYLTESEAQEIAEDGGTVYVVFEEQEPGRKEKSYDLMQGIFEELVEAKEFVNEMQKEEPLYIARYTDYISGNYDYIIQYAVNLDIKDNYMNSTWCDSDNAFWYNTWADAFQAIEDAFANDSTLTEAILTIYTDGGPEDFPLEFVRGEDGVISQYKNGELLVF